MTVILVIATIMVLVLVDYLLKRRWSKTIDETALKRGLTLAGMRIPRGVFFHHGHAWAVVQSYGDIIIGIDDFIRRLAHPIDRIIPNEVGTVVKQGEPLMAVEIDSEQIIVPAPLSGMVKGINQSDANPLSRNILTGLENEWIIDFEPSDLQAELPKLTIAERSREWLADELQRVSEFLGAQGARPELAGQTLQDGGEPAEGAIRLLDADGLAQFEQNFLFIDKQ